MIENINKLAPIINALTVLLSFGFLIWTTCFRKTRRDKIDELKVEILAFVSTVKGHEDWVTAINSSENPGNITNLSNLLGRMYRKKKWYHLLPVALAELRNEGYHELLGVSATTKLFNQPMKIHVGSPSN